MSRKIVELAYLRNQLASGNFSDTDKQLMSEIKQKILRLNNLFTELALSAITRCEEDIKKDDFKLATQEIQLIHNFTFNEPQSWNSNYFYKIELLSYLEQIEDTQRIKKLIFSLAKLQDAYNKQFGLEAHNSQVGQGLQFQT